jgi:Zn-dependent peptidase ImmA (M78 family)
MNIKVGSLEYRTVTEHNPENGNDRVWGSVNHETGTICLQENMNDGMKGVTLVHELLHAVMHERGMYEYTNDEALISPLAGGLYALLKDNPKLLDKLDK